jgi:hypothetical protein
VPPTPVVPPRPAGFVPPNAVAHEAPAPGYQAYAPSLPIKSASGLRTATIVLFWVSTVAALFMALAAFSRKSTFDGFISGTKTLEDVDNADAAIGVALLAYAAGMLAAVIVLAIWSHRSVGNAKKVTNALDLSPGLAAGGWFIPVASLIVPFTVLRRAARSIGLDGKAVSRWQLGFLLVAVGFVGFRAFGSFDAFLDDADTVSDKLRNQGIAGVAITAALAFTTVAAARAMKQLDTGTERRNAGQPAS